MVKNKESEQKFDSVLTDAVAEHIPRIVYWLQTNELVIKTYKVIEVGGRWTSGATAADITAPDVFVTTLKLKGFPLTMNAVRTFELNAPNLFFNMGEAFKALDDAIKALMLDASRKEPNTCED